ncbi:ABC transporter G family member 23-like [Oppia nitens]|uniref:ABC transporter G family member 23-like n=1 Tax=Oppia nitens TaxID=1686743 RepID=UPI0023DA26E2|nr:ABC transporter G family member 23-like [Oppia nitens]
MNNNYSNNVNPNIFAINVENVSFSYNNKSNILNDVTLKVNKGQIFALLGSNGCGKTTLSRLILGLLMPTNGTVKVFGQQLNTNPLTIGYMPQEMALCSELTVRQILYYYGMIYNMTNKLIERRIQELNELLCLPKHSLTIRKLSGGQQRLISIAVSIIHKPRLLVLDEPTVGLDSILRARIWSYLENECKVNDLTVMMTTHYIEEAKKSSSVAFIHSGICLKQSAPELLLNEYHCPTLEEVYYYLCLDYNRNQKQNIKSQYFANKCQTNLEKSTKNKSKIRPKFQINANHIMTLLWKNSIRLKQNSMALYIFHLFPLLLVYGLNICFRNPERLNLAIHTAEPIPDLSLKFINAISDKMFDYEIHKTNETAFNSVLSGENTLSIVFDQNFTDNFHNRLLYPMDISDEEVDSSQVKVYADMSSISGYYAQYYLWKVFAKFMTNFATELDFNPNAFSLPIDIQKHIYGNQDFSFSNLFIPGFLISCNFTLALVLATFYAIRDRENGLKERDIVAGVTKLEIYITQLLLIIANIVIQSFIILVFAFKILDYQSIGSLIDIYILLVFISLQGMSFGNFVSLLVKDDLKATIIASYITAPLYVLCGVFWPIESMPIPLQSLIIWSPLTSPIISLRYVMFRGWTISSIHTTQC